MIKLTHHSLTKGHLVNKRKSQSGFAHLAIIIVLVVALLGALGYIYWQNFMQPKTDDNKSSNATSATITENGVTLTISKNIGPVGTVVQVSISGLPADTTPPFAGLNFLASNGGGTTGYDISIDTRTLNSGAYQTDYTIPAQISLGAEPPATPTPTGLSYINLGYTDPVARNNQQPSDKELKVPFTVTK